MVTPLHRKLWRDIGRHRAQFIAITITMFLGVTIFGATYDSFQNLQASYDSTATEFRFANLTVVGGDVETVTTIADQMTTVDATATRTSVDIPFRLDETKLFGRAVGIPATGQPAVNQIEVLSGAYLSPANPNGVLVEKHMADHFELTPGDLFDILDGETWLEVTVTGVVASPEYIWPARDRQEIITTPDNFGVVFTSEDLARELAGSGPNEAIIYYADGEEVEEVTVALTQEARSLGATSVYTREEQASNAALSEDLKGFEEMAVFFPIMFLTAAAMAAYVMISRLVHTQRPHIGVFLANGFTRRQVLRHYLGYGLVPGLIGSIPGAIAGVLLARVITQMYTGMLSIPITLVKFYPATLIGAVAFGLFASLLSALAPALVASRVLPAEAMRGETPAGGGRRSIFERLVPPLRRIPVGWKMALRGVGRNPRRTVYTIVGVVLSLMLVLVSWGMIDTIQHLMDRQFVEIQQEDATVYFAGSATTDDVAALLAIDGVAVAEPALTLPVSLEADGNRYETALLVLEDDTEMHRLMSTTGDWIDLPKKGIVLGQATQGLLDIDIGDPVNIALATGISVAEPVAAFVDEPLGTMAYVSRSRAENLTATELPATSALISYADDVDAKELRNTVTELPQVAAFEDANVLYDMVQNFMILFYAFVGVMLVFGGAMAFALIFSAMSVNIAERSREVATLLAVGTDRQSISRYITTENLLVVAMGIPIGLLVGYYAAKSALGSFSSDLFAFDLYIRPTTYVWASLAILVVALISQRPGLRAIRKLSIPKVVKERSA
ncbi:MAG: FtsX-like permease family protein [Actinomycetota bacterium]|nr:FtsX-like permease family protein [Actinomycetota bacterium]